MEFRDVVRALRASWWLLLGGLLVGGLAGLALSLLMTPRYTAHTQLFVSTGNSIDILTGSQFAQQRVASYAQVLTGVDMAARVIDELELEMAPAELSGAIMVTSVQDTVVLDVTVTDSSPERARDIAEAVGSVFGDVVREMETPAGAEGAPVAVSAIDRPQLPQVPTEPRTVRNVGLGAVMGLLIGGAAGAARSLRDRSLRDSEVIAALAGAPVLGSLLRDDALAKRGVIEPSGTTRTTEQYRRLQTNLRFLDGDNRPHVIMVASASAGEGKTTVAVNLSLALAHAGHRVALVEANLRRPEIGRRLGLNGELGLTDVLAGTAELDRATQPYGEAGMVVIVSGETAPNPGELLGSMQMADVLNKLRGGTDFVIVDAPPILPVADSSGLAASVDGALLVVRYGGTRKEQLQQAVVDLERVRAKTLGVVLNMVPAKADIS